MYHPYLESSFDPGAPNPILEKFCLDGVTQCVETSFEIKHQNGTEDYTVMYGCSDFSLREEKCEEFPIENGANPTETGVNPTETGVNTTCYCNGSLCNYGCHLTKNPAMCNELLWPHKIEV